MIFETLQRTGLPCSYSPLKAKIDPPYIVYIGRGQNTFGADNTWIWRENRYQVEYYFTKKNEDNERAIEDALLEDGYNYEKSEDIFVEQEGVFLIYYYI